MVRASERLSTQTRNRALLAVGNYAILPSESQRVSSRFESRPESFSTIVLYLRVIAEVPVIRAAAAV